MALLYPEAQFQLAVTGPRVVPLRPVARHHGVAPLLPEELPRPAEQKPRVAVEAQEVPSRREERRSSEAPPRLVELIAEFLAGRASAPPVNIVVTPAVASVV